LRGFTLTRKIVQAGIKIRRKKTDGGTKRTVYDVRRCEEVA
jgi:hypothetical protein